jgi:hypothetical protein
MPDLTLDKLLIFVFAITPGLFSMQLYALWHPGQKREWGSALLEILTYSSLNFVPWFPWIARLIQPGYAAAHPPELCLAFLLICLLSPTLLTTVFSLLRWYILPKLGMDHPTRTAWDHYIRRHRTFFVLAYLKGGEMIGGLYAERSYASAFPVDPELYVQEVWQVDKDGRFLEAVPASLGTVIRLSECKTIEFFKVEVEPDVTQGSAPVRAAGQVNPSAAPGGGAGAGGQAVQPNPPAAGGNGSGKAAV